MTNLEGKKSPQLSQEELKQWVAGFHGQFGEERAFVRFLEMSRAEQEDWLIKLAEQVANHCADAEGEVPVGTEYDLDYCSVSAGWAGWNAHALSILLCLYLKRNWDVETGRLNEFKRNGLVLPYPGEEL